MESVVVDEMANMLLGMQFSQAPDSECEAALKQTRRCWLSKGTKVATAEEHCISSQFLCL